MMESLYTNQIGSDTIKVKTVHLRADCYARLSAAEIAQIATVGLNVVEG